MITQDMINANSIVCDCIDIFEDTGIHRKFCGDSAYALYVDEDKLVIADKASGNIYYWPMMSIHHFTCHPVKEDKNGEQSIG